jgi:signal transduction histidine kinase
MIRQAADAPTGNLLIVDRTSKNLNLLAAGLGDNGYRVRTEMTGSMALVKATSQPPDLILLDLNLPDMAADEFCQKLKKDERTSRIPIILICDRDEVQERIQALSIGEIDYIIKPWRIEEFLARIEINLTSHQLAQRLEERDKTLQQLSVQLAEQNIRLQHEINCRCSAEQREQEKNQQIDRLSQQLQHIQRQLINSQQRFSLGSLLASWMEELHQPIDLISGNLELTNLRVQSLLNVVDRYQSNSENLQHATEPVKLDWLQCELFDLLNSIQENTTKISKTIQSADRVGSLHPIEFQAIDLHQCLDSIVATLQNGWLSPQLEMTNFRIFKEYGHLPKVTCNSQQIEQVFWQIILNAIAALESRYSQEFWERSELEFPDRLPIPTITIVTECIENSVKVTIADNGIGMPESVQDRVFNVNAMGGDRNSKKGMGLIVSYAIVVQQHRGQLRCLSVPGEGTSLEIELPIDRN